MTQTDRDTPVTALDQLLTNVEYLMEEHGTRLIDIEDLRAVVRDQKRALASSDDVAEDYASQRTREWRRRVLGSSDDVAGSGERLRKRIEALECPDKASMFDPSDRFATGWLVAINQVLEVLAAPTTDAPKDAER